MLTWASAAPAISAAFLASLVEAVEAVTIVLAVATVRGWRSAGVGALAGLVSLALIVLTLGPLLERVPLRALQFVIGVLLLLFGMRWLRKAILRAAGVVALRDEQIAFENESARLRNQAHRQRDVVDRLATLEEFKGVRPQGFETGLRKRLRLFTARLNWLAALASFKAVLLEGLEVVFIVLAVGAGRGLLGVASIGALAACTLIVAIGFAAHRPLARVPENTLKFAVGILLSAFGVFWTGEGLGVPWPGEDLAILGIAALFLLVATATVAVARRPGAQARS
jgi:uncharacterized membrane protein